MRFVLLALKSKGWVVKVTTHSFRLHSSCYEATPLQRFTTLKATCFQKRLATACYIQSQLQCCVILRQFERSQHHANYNSFHLSTKKPPSAFIVFDGADCGQARTAVDKWWVEPKLPAGQAREYRSQCGTCGSCTKRFDRTSEWNETNSGWCISSPSVIWNAHLLLLLPTSRGN